MSRNAAGTYTLYSPGNPVVSLTTITSTWANNTLTDIANALTDSLSRSGLGGMTAQLRAISGTAGTPGYAFNTELTTGLFSPAANTLGFSTTGVERGRINNAGQWLIGGTAARANFNNSVGSPFFQMEGTSFNTATLAAIRNSADANGPFVTFGKTRAAAVGGTTIVVSGDVLGRVSWQGSDGTEFVEAGYISGEVDGTPGANDMPGRIVFAVTPDGLATAAEVMRISSTGNVNIGGSPSSAISLGVRKNLTGSTGVNGIRSDGTVQSDATASAIMFVSAPATAAAAFTLAALTHFSAVQGTIGAGSAVTTQIGYNVDPSLIGAGTNIGFRSQIPDAANRWNNFHDGTAPNYFAGEVRVGTTTDGGAATDRPGVEAGKFVTIEGSVVTTSGVAATCFTLPTVPQSTWIISVGINGGGAGLYSETTIISTDNATASASILINGANITISFSGLIVQVTQTSGAGQTVLYRAIRIA